MGSIRVTILPRAQLIPLSFGTTAYSFIIYKIKGIQCAVHSSVLSSPMSISNDRQDVPFWMARNLELCFWIAERLVSSLCVGLGAVLLHLRLCVCVCVCASLCGRALFFIYLFLCLPWFFKIIIV